MAAAMDDESVPGRPRKVVARRSKRIRERVASFHEAEERFVEVDQVVLAASVDDRLEVLHVTREALAREAAGLLFARLQAIPGSREMGRLATKRISALRDIANLTLSIARIETGLPSPERMGRILGFLMTTIEEAAENVLPGDTARAFSDAWRARIEPALAQLATAPHTLLGSTTCGLQGPQHPTSKRRL